MEVVRIRATTGSHFGRKALLITCAAVLALGVLAGCGKKNAPKPPGPNPTYPKTFPSS